MAIEDKMTERESDVGEQELTKDEQDDLAIMLTLGKNLIDDGGYEVIEQAQNSKDPGVVIAQFLMQLSEQLAEQLPFEPSARILLAEDGWVEQISDFLQEDYNVPKKIMDRAEIYMATAAQQMAQAGQQQQQAPQQGMEAQGAPPMPMPQGGM